MNKIQQGATSLPQNRPEPYIEQRVVHTFTGVSIHQEPVEIPEQSEGDSSAFEGKPFLTDLNEIARYIEKFSQLPTDQIMDIYGKTGVLDVEDIDARSAEESNLNADGRALSNGEISIDELNSEDDDGAHYISFRKFTQNSSTFTYTYASLIGVVWIEYESYK